MGYLPHQGARGAPGRHGGLGLDPRHGSRAASPARDPRGAACDRHRAAASGALRRAGPDREPALFRHHVACADGGLRPPRRLDGPTRADPRASRCGLPRKRPGRPLLHADASRLRQARSWRWSGAPRSPRSVAHHDGWIVEDDAYGFLPPGGVRAAFGVSARTQCLYRQLRQVPVTEPSRGAPWWPPRACGTGSSTPSGRPDGWRTRSWRRSPPG